MKDRFEATFVVDVPTDEVWKALTQDERTEAGGPRRFWLPGFPNGTGELLELDPCRTLRLRKDQMPCQGTEIAITLEAAESGTRVTVVQSGFGAAFEAMLNYLEIGWEQIVADLIVFLARGVLARRHERPWRDIGCGVQQVPGGVELIGDVAQGSFAERVGLHSGDLLIALSDSPVVSLRDYFAAVRALVPGQKVQATWARGRELMTGVGVV